MKAFELKFKTTCKKCGF